MSVVVAGNSYRCCWRVEQLDHELVDQTRVCVVAEMCPSDEAKRSDLEAEQKESLQKIDHCVSWATGNVPRFGSRTRNPEINPSKTRIPVGGCWHRLRCDLVAMRICIRIGVERNMLVDPGMRSCCRCFRGRGDGGCDCWKDRGRWKRMMSESCVVRR